MSPHTISNRHGRYHFEIGSSCVHYILLGRIRLIITASCQKSTDPWSEALRPPFSVWSAIEIPVAIRLVEVYLIGQHYHQAKCPFDLLQ